MIGWPPLAAAAESVTPAAGLGIWLGIVIGVLEMVAAAVAEAVLNVGITDIWLGIVHAVVEVVVGLVLVVVVVRALGAGSRGIWQGSVPVAVEVAVVAVTRGLVLVEASATTVGRQVTLQGNALIPHEEIE